MELQRMYNHVATILATDEIEYDMKCDLTTTPARSEDLKQKI